MKKAALYSLILHVVIALFVLVGLPNPFKSKTMDSQPLLIDFVQIAEKSAAPVLTPKAMQEPKPQPKEEDVEPVKQEQAEQMETDTSAKEQEEPKKEEPKVEPKPEIAPQEPEIDEDPNAEPLPEIKPKKKPMPKEEKKEEPKPKEQEKPKELSPSKVKKRPTPSKPKALQTLDKKLDSVLDDAQEKPKKKKASKSFDDVLDDLEKDDSSDSGVKGAPAQSISDTLTGSEIDAIRRTIYKCWIVPAGARGAKDLVVDVDMSVAPDGTVTKADVSDKSRLSDPAYRSAAESAVRAVLDPACNPLPIPEGKYEQFKELTLSFNPKDMF